MHNQFKTQKFKHLMLAMGPRDLNSALYSPVHCSSHSMTSFQSSELTELPVVENSQLFAQRVHSARTAHGTPPMIYQQNNCLHTTFCLSYPHCRCDQALLWLSVAVVSYVVCCVLWLCKVEVAFSPASLNHGRERGGVMSGFEMTSMILTSCETESVRLKSVVLCS